MDALVREVFAAAQIVDSPDEKNGNKNDRQRVDAAMTRLEQWLDMENDSLPQTWIPEISPNDILLMEDCAPFSWNFYQSVGRVLVEAWNPTSDGGNSYFSNNHHKHGIFRSMQESSPNIQTTHDDVSLFHVPSVRVTRWVRYWMDLNVMGTNHNPDDSVTTFSEFLLRHCEGNTKSKTIVASETMDSGGPKRNEENQRRVARVYILKALFHHIASLPQLQQQVHAYTQSLLHSKPDGTTSLDATLRLEQLKASNKVSEKLTRELNAHLEHLEDILGDWYCACNPTLRASCRMNLGRLWQGYIHVSSHKGVGGVGGRSLENTSACGIATTLRVLNRILRGGNSTTQSPNLYPSHEHLLFELLIPLHRPSGMVLWRDQTPLLDLYHKPLVQCVGTILQRSGTQRPQLTSRVVSQLLNPEIWPSSQGAGSASANTPKVVLLLHEIDIYLGLLSKQTEQQVSTDLMDSFHDSIGPLTVRLGACISSDNSRMSERALQLFKNDTFVSIIKHHLSQTLPTLLRALCRTSDQMQLPWNPTVRKMTSLVLQELEKYNQEAFAQACQSLFSTRTPSKRPAAAEESSKQAASPEGTAMMKLQEAAPTKPQDFSLRAGMGSWKPPTQQQQSRRTHASNKMLPPPARPPRNNNAKQPPLTVTGMAPWAVSSLPTRSSSSSSAPPLTVTGVAPWANRPSPPTSSMRPPKKRAEAAKGLPHRPSPPINQEEKDNIDSLPTTIEEDTDDSEVSTSDSENNTGLARVRRYMEELQPSSSDQDEEGGASSWARAQMSESPTLLPTLKFHDLVFGHDLGSGAFGSVRYARQIVKSKTRSHWPEYAVKIVSTQRIEEMGYEQSINREIAILRLLSHPGIARLISSFRFRDGAYLVLEYANGGDLHTLLKNSGSLNEESTKFVIGSIVAALWSIHDLGFVYGDLKPENILITETRHIKLTDFGGCRPVTDHAKELIRYSSKNLLNELRDGDWKPKNTNKARKGNTTSDDDSDLMDVDDPEQEEEDHRVEGTTAYLPPEVVIGAVPTPPADSWALGCVLYQCVSGRPPLLEDDDIMTRNKIVAFHLASESAGHDSREALFDVQDQQNMAITFSQEIRNLVLGLLHRDPSSRPNMLQVAEDEFFRGTDVFSLHKNPGYPLDVGSVAPVADAKWSRRQFSSIWAPQPENYDVIGSSAEGNKPSSASSHTAPIPEGEEASAFFSKSLDQSQFGNIPENVPVA